MMVLAYSQRKAFEADLIAAAIVNMSNGGQAVSGNSGQAPRPVAQVQENPMMYGTDVTNKN